MNLPLLMPTPTELKAHKLRRAFYKRIADAAAALNRIDPAPLKVEATPAEPDPPSVLDCPQCAALKAALAVHAPIKVAGRSCPPIRAIQAVVASYFDVTRGDLCSDRRLKEVVLPRQIAMYLSKELTPFSLPKIGQMFGGRDHTTVLHSYRKIGAMIFADASFAIEVISLRLVLETGEG